VKKNVKIILAFLIASLLLFTVSFNIFADSSAASVGIVTENGAVGDIINVDLKLNCTGVGSVTADLSYDPDELQFLRANVFIAGLKFKYNSANLVNGQSVVRFTGSVDDLDGVDLSGIVMQVEFKILKADGTSTVSASASAYTPKAKQISAASASSAITVYDSNSSVIYDPTVAVGEVYDEYKNISNSVKITDSAGKSLNSASTVRTGDLININNGEVVKTVSLSGDLNSDGKVNTLDYLMIS